LNSALIARGSEDIENHADQIIIMAQGKNKPTLMDEWSKEILLKCTKNRYGPEGGKSLYHLIGKHFQFKETDEDTAELDIEPAEESRPKKGK
jgi:hypothetical protein